MYRLYFQATVIVKFLIRILSEVKRKSEIILKIAFLASLLS